MKARLAPVLDAARALGSLACSCNSYHIFCARVKGSGRKFLWETVSPALGDDLLDAPPTDVLAPGYLVCWQALPVELEYPLPALLVEAIGL